VADEPAPQGTRTETTVRTYDADGELTGETVTTVTKTEPEPEGKRPGFYL
jgi:hypothetical protein